MATIKKIRKIKRNHFFRLSLILFAFALISFVGCNLFLRSYQASVSRKTQNLIAEVNRLTAVNEALAVEVAALSNYDRIVALASAEGLSLVQGNVINIKDGE